MSFREDLEECTINRCIESDKNCRLRHTDADSHKSRLMLNDIKISRDFNKEFVCQVLGKSTAIRLVLNVQILLNGAWPLHQLFSAALNGTMRPVC